MNSEQMVFLKDYLRQRNLFPIIGDYNKRDGEKARDHLEK